MKKQFGLRNSMVCAALWLSVSTAMSIAQQTTGSRVDFDADRDGLSDALEQQLLEQFRPRFMIAEHDCSAKPAGFRPEVTIPEVQGDDGTIYGQVFPAKGAGSTTMAAEIHYYHLWRKDCGDHGHSLDAEHVATLVASSDANLASASWKALYWYSAAHENTVCDVSQIARASTLNAQDHGATVWISPGKHASYLNETLCHRGCGADRCEKMVPLDSGAIINLGEPGFPMNGARFVSSPAWSLEAKMRTSNFPPAALARLTALPETDIASFNPGRHPAQGIIARSNTTEQALSNSARNTTAAISSGGSSTDDALAAASDSTSLAVSASEDSTARALGKSYRHTVEAVGTSLGHVRKALRLTPTVPDKRAR